MRAYSWTHCTAEREGGQTCAWDCGPRSPFADHDKVRGVRCPLFLLRLIASGFDQASTKVDAAAELGPRFFGAVPVETSERGGDDMQMRQRRVLEQAFAPVHRETCSRLGARARVMEAFWT